MGKGDRKRQQQIERLQERQQASLRLVAEERRVQRGVTALCILAMLILVIPAIVQIFTIQTLATSAQTDEVAAQMPMMLLMGGLGTALMVIGTIVAAVLLFTRRPLASTFGVGAMLIGVICLAVFIAMLATCFPYREEFLGNYVREVGLNFNKLALRHGTAMVPFVPMLIAMILGLRGAKKRDMIEMLNPETTSISTLTLTED